MVDYQPLLSRAVAMLGDAFAARHSIYERARIAQRAQLQMQYPPLRESEIAREQEALERAIALVESKFSGERASPPETPFASGTRTAVTQNARETLTARARTEPRTYISLQIGPQCAGPEKSGMRLWLVPTAALAGLFAAVLGAVLAITGAAIVMRNTPPDLARAPPEGLQEPPPERPTKIIERSQPSPAESNSSAPPATVPRPTGQSGLEPATPTRDASSSELTDTARAVMLIASDDPKRPMVSRGETVWSIIPPVPGRPATVGVRADADIPDLKMHATMILRKNTDPALQATHTIDLKFSFDVGAPIAGIKNVDPKMRNLGLAPSEELRNVSVKISDTYFLISLNSGADNAAYNLSLFQSNAWFDFALLLNDNRIAKFLLQKSLIGKAVLAKAFEAWK